MPEDVVGLCLGGGYRHYLPRREEEREEEGEDVDVVVAAGCGVGLLRCRNEVPEPVIS